MIDGNVRTEVSREDAESESRRLKPGCPFEMLIYKTLDWLHHSRPMPTTRGDSGRSETGSVFGALETPLIVQGSWAGANVNQESGYRDGLAWT